MFFFFILCPYQLRRNAHTSEGAEGFRLSMQQQQARHKYDIWPIFAKSEGVTATLAPLFFYAYAYVYGCIHHNTGSIFCIFRCPSTAVFFVAWAAHFAKCTNNYVPFEAFAKYFALKVAVAHHQICSSVLTNNLHEFAILKLVRLSYICI